MEYTIHGKTIQYEGRECGIYKSALDRLGQEYAVMNIDDLVARINFLPRDKAISAVTALDVLALEQSQWTQTPQNMGYPLLIGGPERTPIGRVKPFIQNTYSLTQAMLKALQEN